jgi:hypothetical protein
VRERDCFASFWSNRRYDYACSEIFRDAVSLYHLLCVSAPALEFASTLTLRFKTTKYYHEWDSLSAVAGQHGFYICILGG